MSFPSSLVTFVLFVNFIEGALDCFTFCRSTEHARFARWSLTGSSTNPFLFGGTVARLIMKPPLSLYVATGSAPVRWSSVYDNKIQERPRNARTTEQQINLRILTLALMGGGSAIWKRQLSILNSVT